MRSLRLPPPAQLPCPGPRLPLARALVLAACLLQNASFGAEPDVLSEDELARRRQDLDAWTFEPVAIDLGRCLVHLDRRDGSFFFQDARTAVKWFSSWGRRGFASVRVDAAGGPDAPAPGAGQTGAGQTGTRQTGSGETETGGTETGGTETGGTETGGTWLPVDRVEDLRVEERRISFRGASSRGEIPEIRFRVEALEEMNGVSISYDVKVPEGSAGRGPDGGQASPRGLPCVRLLEDALWIPDSEPGGVALPRGMGEWHAVAAADDLDLRFSGVAAPSGVAALRDAAGGPLELPFLSPTRGENPLLLRWKGGDPEHPGVVRIVRRAVLGAEFPGRRGIFLSLEMNGTSGSVEIRTLGKEWSPVVDAARAYLALRLADPRSPRGASGTTPVPSLRMKVSSGPETVSFLGAAVFRPELGGGVAIGQPARAGGRDALDAIVRHAERIRRDLGVDQAAYIVGGWEEAGASGESPPPEEPEVAVALGGALALRECARRVRDQGFLFGLEVRRAPRPAAASAYAVALRDGLGARIALFGGAPQRSVFPNAEAYAAARMALARAAAETVGIGALSGFHDADAAFAAYAEGALDAYVRAPASPTFWPILTATYGHSIRLGASPALALGPADTEALLAHLLVGEVPVYAFSPSGGGPEDADAGVAVESIGAPADRDAARAIRHAGLFARDDGWAAAKGLSPGDVFLKNTYEVLSHVARIRAREQLLFHRALVPDASVRETYFGPDLRIVVNFGPDRYEDPEDGFVLPPRGFYVRHPFLLAFCALRANDLEYDRPAFFVVRSLEGKMYLRAEETRIYHGFGPARIRIAGRDFDVEREAVVRIW